MSNPDGIAERLDAAMAIPDSYEFVNALSTLARAVSQRMSVDYLALPPLVRMPLLLDELHLFASAKGMLVFLEMGGMGEKAPLMAEGCRLIGATRAAEYLKAAGRLFPGGRIPASDDDIMAYSDDVDDAEQRFYALDTAYAGALDEMGECLRAFVRDRRPEFARALTPPLTTPAPRPIPPGQSLAEQTALIQSRIAAYYAKQDAVFEPVRQAAMARGMVPWTPSVNDGRYAAFVEAVNCFDEARWREVVLRVGTARGRVGTVHLLIRDVRDWLAHRGLQDAPASEAAWRQGRELLRPAQAVIAGLPPEAEVDGAAVHVRQLAALALGDASAILFYDDWLMPRAQGLAAARFAYPLFDGLAPLPELPTPKRKSRARKRA